MKEKLTLMIPGPTPVPERVLKALSKHPIGHRSREFQDIVKSTTELLKWLHQTKGDVLTITGSGTAAMEAGIINTLSKGDKVICGENGKFGERWVKVAKAYGLEVITVKANWGEPLDPENFKNLLNDHQDIRAVIITHSETSTGVINDLEKISSYVKHHKNAITIADCVTSIGACEVKMDDWGVDVIASGSQKGYMMPPGLSFVAMSEKAWQANIRSDLPKFYLDLISYKKTVDKDSNPFTPGVNLYFALEEALIMMKEEGLESIFMRHQRHMKATQEAMKSIGLNLFAKNGFGSPSITSIMPEGIDAEKIRKTVKEDFDILLAGGQDNLKGKIFRIGHLGFINDRDIITAIASIEATLNKLGKSKYPIGTGVAIATKILNERSN
ncbi:MULTISPECIES: pyridoxal-phosphate-dependent aminotransferase family protein [Prochlorococcus]|uniref:Serine-pyruvate/aspartate aminotransferase related enzyme n=1 Tax=Prochlorococcus marinus (strain SARG / CCMP1375 / SS120) TaxID=167539 RepID=Q7VEH7_PROMA|nr:MULTISPECIES: alanine--glyoxylate aminotransferase family protein [Prochlorococcus]AAP99082.1 Serine-pyruvate/aspartate aminotransferase related enzyme [Prochlorococcus marinus subsp. marinus str. CCMP1375]KGG11661.1 Serine--glyoxylate aminotransferase [Prochlorococcus marinus str. LG]KGG22330.1 Serine--glyoxylate aminotransferase [Prochlorococcus marinus str. SS2]KGG22666.1 Serine--glyoxylate aminotransferase [Prochlorococcus marinus str. SS35]KGG32913.1 Serine--glyoxylate aminotransferase